MLEFCCSLVHITINVKMKLLLVLSYRARSGTRLLFRKPATVVVVGGGGQ
jgi:hypothetical protein